MAYITRKQKQLLNELIYRPARPVTCHFRDDLPSQSIDWLLN